MATSSETGRIINYKCGKIDVYFYGRIEWEADEDGYAIPVFATSKGKWIAVLSYRMVSKGNTIHYGNQGGGEE